MKNIIKSLIAIALLSGCAAQTQPDPGDICLTHNETDLEQGRVTLSATPEPAACPFGAHGEPTSLQGDPVPVSVVCYCWPRAGETTCTYACFGSPGAAQWVGDDRAPAAPLYVSCTIVTDTQPSADCAPGQLSVTRCSSETANPDETRCAGPVGSEMQTEGKVWCCVPGDVAGAAQ